MDQAVSTVKLHDPEQHTKSGQNHSKSSLGRRIIIVMLLISSLLSLIASTIQLFLSYDRDRNEILSTFDTIQNSFQSGLENALWEFNFQQIEYLLDGIEANSNVAQITLTATTKQRWTRGNSDTPSQTIRSYKLQYMKPNRSVTPVGQMDVVLSMDHAKSRLVAQFWSLILTNFAKTMIVASAMIAVLQWLVFRHLRTITNYVHQSNWLSGSDSLQLYRHSDTNPDDLDDIVVAINFAQNRDRLNYDNLALEVRHREQSQTLLRQKANELEVANSELAQSNKEQSEFAYALSHDLKSPATSLGMLLDEIMLNSRDQLNEDSGSLLSQARLVADRMNQQIDSVLSYSRSITKTVKLNRVDLTEIIKVAIENIQSEVKSSNALVGFDTPHVVSGDATLLTILFSNLLSNAIKYQPDDNPPQIRVASDLDTVANTVSVSVIDNGIGIEEKHQAQIFGLFKRLHLATEYPGSGIGLSLCQRIARKHGGEIKLYSKLGHGATFQVVLRNWNSV